MALEATTLGQRFVLLVISVVYRGCAVPIEIYARLNMDFGQFGWLRHHQLQKGFEQAFTPDPDVVHELKEAQVERQFFL